MRTAGNAADRGWRTWKKKNSILGGVLVGPAERSALLRFGGEGGGVWGSLYAYYAPVYSMCIGGGHRCDIQ